jgi:hypothetical protein
MMIALFLSLSTPETPCAAPPPGMTCIEGGAVEVGRDDGPRNEAPRRKVEISTFYVDDAEMTAEQVTACVRDGACPPRKAALLDYDAAVKLCTWAGKRLPTEWEWEKAAPRIAGMIGDGDEWTATWAGEAPGAPCQQCAGRDPMGICSSTDPCSRGGGMKVVRGASVTARRFAPLSKRAQIRCASSSPLLWGFPTRQGSAERPVPPPPAPPTPEQVRIAHAIQQDTLDKQECAAKGRSHIDCRDPNSYIKTNEPRQSLWVRYIKNLGGGYTGVGIDQNYSLIAVQRAEWAWLFDYDPVVVNLHRALRALIKDAPDRAAFLRHFDDEGKAHALEVLAQEYGGDRAVREVYAISRKPLARYYEKQTLGEKDDPTYGWLATDDAYRYVRLLYEQDRIVVLKGDMLAKHTMQGIGAAARALGVAIRVYYPSNAPEFWPHAQQYKDNVLALPFDEHSVVLQTMSGLKPGFGEKKKGYWHYNVQSGLMQQELMRRRGVGSLPQLVMIRNKTDDPDLTVSGLPKL